MICIFCGKENKAQSIEHIVSEAFGNKDYVMERGAVCDECNNKFSSFEGKAVSQSVFVMERARMGMPTKKGGPASGRVGGLKISGNKELVKNLITMEGLTLETMQNFDPEKGTGQVFVKTFDGSEVATSKLLLKMALESLYTSQRKIYEKYDFSELREFLLNPGSTDWPFMTTGTELTLFASIPRFNVKYRLGVIRCTLEISEVSDNILLFKFKYGAIPMMINLLDRKGLLWMKQYQEADPQAMIYPEHYRAKLEKRVASQTARAVRQEIEEAVAVKTAPPVANVPVAVKNESEPTGLGDEPEVARTVSRDSAESLVGKALPRPMDENVAVTIVNQDTELK